MRASLEETGITPQHCLDLLAAFTAIDDDAAARLYERKLVLVRPDGHVAWRGDHASGHPLAVIDCIRGAPYDGAKG